MFLVAQLYSGILENNAFIYAKASHSSIFVCNCTRENILVLQVLSRGSASALMIIGTDINTATCHGSAGGVSDLRMDLLEHLQGATAGFPFIIYLSQSL